MKQKMNRLTQALMKKTNKVLFASLAVALALIIGLLSHFQMFGFLVRAEEAKALYVGEVRVYQGKTAEAAADACKKDGFTPIEGNLNEGTDEDAVVLGYITTENQDEAITDIRMMQMTSGFSTINYKDLVARQYPGLDSVIDEQYDIIKEFKSKVESGSYNAKTALSFLNLYEIPELNMKLGDYYLSDSLNKEMLQKLLLQTAAAVSTTAYNQLALGVSDCSEDNWASRVYQNKDILEFPENEDGVEAGADPYAQLDRDYLSSAERLVDVIHDFSTKYQTGIARVNANDGKMPDPDPEETSPEELSEIGSESLALTSYGVLNLYKYDDNTLLGDWLVEMGNLTLSNKAELRNLYPLIASMTHGQIVTTQMVGLPVSTFYLNDLSGAEKDIADSINEAKKECRDFDNAETISVWTGVDQKLFDQECAVTGDAQRYTNLKDTAENLLKRNKFIATLEAISSWCSTTTSLAGITALGMLPNMMVGWFAKDAAIWAANHTTLAWIFGGLAKGAAYVSAGCTLITLAILLIMVIVFLYDCLKPECDDLSYTDIPTVTMDLSADVNDSDNRGMLRYDLIQSPDGKADLNAYEGKQWNALYASQNTQAGKPIVVPDNGAPFIVKTNDAENPAGYKAVRNFDEIYAANLNANVKEEDAPAVYLFYSYPGESANTTEVKDEDQPEEAQDEDSQGEEAQEATAPAEEQSASTEKKQYIASLYLSCEGSETIAKSKLTQQGYKVIDVNLTPELRATKQSYSYLGYTVTTNEKAAVTDIRMAKIKSTSQAVMYGTVKYTAAGFDGHGNSICYTKDTSVGSPILADDIQIADKLTDGKKGYVPVCYFGSAAYNFNACESHTKWDNAKYIFFSPSEKFTSGTEYISGLYFVSGANAEETGWSLTEYAEKLGGKLLGEENFTKGRQWHKKVMGPEYGMNCYVKDMQTYLCYTTTYNPKRALYDVQFYAGTPRMQNVLTMMTAYTGNNDANYASTGYGVVNVFMQSSKSTPEYQSATAEMEYLSHFEVNNYDDFTVNMREPFEFDQKEVDNIIPGVKWQTVINQPRVLYACGYKQGYRALVPGDLVLSGSSEVPAGFASVQDVKFPFEKEPLNLAYYYHEKSDECSPAYLYIRRAAPVRGKYIASVKVATYNPDPEWEEEERKANDDFSNDLCFYSLASVSSELLLQNLRQYSVNTWYYKSDKGGEWAATDYEEAAAYLGVTYTDNPAKAIHGLLRMKAKLNETPTETLTVNGAKYSLVQNVTNKEPTPIVSANGEMYYLYATTSSGGSSTGDALTEIKVSENVFEPGMSTVLTVDHGDIPAKKDFYGNVTAPAEYAIPYGDTEDVLYIHQKTNTDLTGIDSFFVGVGDTEAEAMKDLLTQGATNCLPLNMNKGSSSDASVFIGYHYYNPDYVNTKRTKYYMESAVKDLYVYVGENPEKRLTIDKRKYTLCGNRNLNYGTGGMPMYLYQTTALINSKDKNDASYITFIAAAQYDRVPADIAENRRENLLTTKNERINMNKGLNGGVRGFDQNSDEQHLIDSRIYVFVHRNDNYVKPEAVITGGYFTETTTFGDVVLNKK